MKIWVRALRLPFITASVMPFVLGTVIAWQTMHVFNLHLFMLAIFATAFGHLASNLMNDYFDQKADSINTEFSQISGGSRVIQEKLLPAKKILFVSLIFFAHAAGFGIALTIRLNSIIPILLASMGVFIGFFYTAPPLKFSYRGIGEILIGYAFGPLIVIGAFFVQTGTISIVPFLASIPIALLIIAIILINEFPDAKSDEEAQKYTLVVLLGKKTSAKIYYFLLALTYASIGVFTAYKIFPPWTLLALITLPIAWKSVKITAEHYDSKMLMPANLNTLKLHILVSILLIVGFML